MPPSATPDGPDSGGVGLFFAVAFLWSWAIWAPSVAVYRAGGGGVLTWWMLVAGVAGAWGPSVAALAVTGMREGTGGLRRLVAGFLVWRVGWVWYVVALLLPAALLAAGILIQSVWSGTWSRLEPSGWALRLVAAALFVLPFGPLGEELGWRGYALPRLQARFTALTSSLIIGAFWAAWHIPLFWVPGAALSPDAAVNFTTAVSYAASVIATSILFTWLYNNTAASLVLAVLFHLALNVTGQVVLPMFPDLTAPERLRIDFLRFVAVNWCLVLVVLAMFGPARLRRRAAEM